MGSAVPWPGRRRDKAIHRGMNRGIPDVLAEFLRSGRPRIASLPVYTIFYSW